MRTLEELLDTNDPALPLVRAWIARAVRPVEVLEPSAARAEVLLQLQVTTRSTMGAVAYETGGILIDHGWLRILGSGHPRLVRTLPGWNAGRSDRFCLAGDDAVGGFFAINGGAFGDDLKSMYYFAPDTLGWEPMNIGYTQFLEWICTGNYAGFCEDLRWPGWEAEVQALHGDSCLMSYPPLWTREGRESGAIRREIPVAEAWGAQMDLARQIGSGGELERHPD